jgi:hypothetical protein
MPSAYLEHTAYQQVWDSCVGITCIYIYHTTGLTDIQVTFHA